MNDPSNEGAGGGDGPRWVGLLRLALDVVAVLQRSAPADWRPRLAAAARSLRALAR